MNLQRRYDLHLAEQALPDMVRKHIEQKRIALLAPDQMTDTADHSRTSSGSGSDREN